MKNYFFVHTALQLIIAQHIVKRFYHNNENYIFFGHTGSNSQSVKRTLTELCRDDIWAGKYWINDLHKYVPSFSNVYNWFRIRKFLKGFDNVSSSSFFFGDIGHVGYLNFAKYFVKNNGEINFFEEGLSHYSNRLLQPALGNAIILLAKKRLHQFCSRVLYNTSGIGSYVFNSSTTELNLNIRRRFNMLDRQDWTAHDIKIKFDEIFNGTDLGYAKNRLDEAYDNAPCALFLSSTSRNYSDSPLQQELLILQTIGQNFNLPLVYKFHPKDSLDFRSDIKLECVRLGIAISFIENDEPAELLFGLITIAAIFSYGSSAHLYFLSNQTEYNIESAHVMELVNKYHPSDIESFSWLLKYYKDWMQLLETFNINK
jgi:hypothetical protein